MYLYIGKCMLTEPLDVLNTFSPGEQITKYFQDQKAIPHAL